MSEPVRGYRHGGASEAEPVRSAQSATRRAVGGSRPSDVVARRLGDRLDSYTAKG